MILRRCSICNNAVCFQAPNNDTLASSYLKTGFGIPKVKPVFRSVQNAGFAPDKSKGDHSKCCIICRASAKTAPRSIGSPAMNAAAAAGQRRVPCLVSALIKR